MFALGGSAMMFHLQKTMFQSAMPNMADVFKQNPELAAQFANAASGSMGGGRPQRQQQRGGGGGLGGLGNLVGSLFGGGGGGGGLGGLMGSMFGGGGGGGGMPSQETMDNARRAEMDGPGDLDELLKEIEQDRNELNSTRTANVNNRNGPTRVSVERSAANTISLDV